MKAKQIILLIVLGLVLIIMIQNYQVVMFKLLFWTVSMSVTILILITLIIGLLAGYFWARWNERKRRVFNREKTGREYPGDIQP
ncbi:MAG: DUF1049 domain-containing protein [Candidatus Zixiibacteriota bacterium]|nr:MAG: DUF1049 domain-containing protein [candidate division Zixibacteria bacterium]